MNQEIKKEEEKDIVNKIKEIADYVEIPEEMETANMMKTLGQKKKTGKSRRAVWQYTAAACACLALVFICFSVFYSALNEKKESSAVKTEASAGNGELNTAESYKEILTLLQNSQNSGLVTESALDTSNTSSTGKESVETDYSSTNIQVEGVEEGDVVKTDGEYIYVLQGQEREIRIIKDEGGQLQEVSRITTGNTGESYYQGQEIYIKENTLVFIYTDSNGSGESNTFVVTYDITDRAQPEERGRVYQEGTYSSSRMTGDFVYLISACVIYNVLTEDNCVPAVNGEPVEAKEIYLTDSITAPSYNVLTAMDINNPSVYSSTKTVLGNYAQVYVSTENIYITTYVYVQEDSRSHNETEIMKLSYRNGIIQGEKSARVPGTIKDSFCMDEYNGNLRLVTTQTTYTTGAADGREIAADSSSSSSISFSSNDTGNNLYILDENLSIIGKIENLAQGERIYSARFMGDTGYFVTFKNMDPLFAVDLSNPQNPVILGELKITGFSEYLHFWSENLLLGIGKEVNPDTSEVVGVKLSMFDISDPAGVKEIDKIVLTDYQYSYVAENHKAALADSVKNLIGFEAAANYVNGSRIDYLVYEYHEGTGFTQKLKYSSGFNYGNYYSGNTRGIYINDRFFVVQPDVKVSTFTLDDFNLLEEFSLK